MNTWAQDSYIFIYYLLCNLDLAKAFMHRFSKSIHVSCDPAAALWGGTLSYLMNEGTGRRFKGLRARRSLSWETAVQGLGLSPSVTCSQLPLSRQDTSAKESWELGTGWHLARGIFIWDGNHWLLEWIVQTTIKKAWILDYCPGIQGQLGGNKGLGSWASSDYWAFLPRS